MSRPTRIVIDTSAVLHNVKRVRDYAPGSTMMAMVKADAYGCGIKHIVPAIDKHVELLGVASLEEARQVRAAGGQTACVLLSGIFSADELHEATQRHCQLVVHHHEQLNWITHQRCRQPIKVWIKINTGMNRLGFRPEEVSAVFQILQNCPWVDEAIGLMTHFACANTPKDPINHKQLNLFKSLDCLKQSVIQSIANSAAIIAMPEAHADMVRPGIMLYGVSPFSGQIGKAFNLKPVMRFESAITAIYAYEANSPIGYGLTWESSKPSVIGVVPVGYGDGYPRHIQANTPVSIQGKRAPIVGRISMDMMTVDLTHVSHAVVGTPVELWGEAIPVETIAHSAGTIGYELLSQVTARPQSW